MSQGAAKRRVCGAGAEGPASKRVAASPEEVSPVVLQALIDYLPSGSRKALLDSALLALRKPSVPDQQLPCITAREARFAICKAVRVIKVCLTADFLSFKRLTALKCLVPRTFAPWHLPPRCPNVLLLRRFIAGRAED